MEDYVLGTDADEIVDPGEGQNVFNPAAHDEHLEDGSESTTSEPEEKLESVESPEPTERDTLVEAAVKAGANEDDAKALDDESLRRVVRKLDPSISATSDATSDSDANEPSDEASSSKQYKLKVRDDFYEDDLIEGIEDTVDELATDINARLLSLEKRNNELEAQSLIREEVQSKARFDSLIKELPKGYKTTFGSDNPTKSQKANYAQTRKEVEVQRQVRENMGLPPISDSELLQKAIGGQYQIVNKQLAREEITKSLKTRQGQIIATPTHSKGQQKTGYQAAVSAVDSMLEEMGEAIDTVVSNEDSMTVFD